MSNAELIATIAHILEPWAFETKSYNATIARDDATAKATQIVEALAALDSRAGDAGEGDMEHAAKIAETHEPMGYMSEREREYCREHGQEIADRIRIASACTASNVTTGLQSAVAGALNAAWALCDDTENGDSDRPSVPRDAWKRLADALDVLEAMIPKSERPCWPGVAARLLAGRDLAISGMQPVPGHAAGCGAHDDYECDCPATPAPAVDAVPAGEVEQLREALDDAINSPKGVVPVSAEPFYDGRAGRVKPSETASTAYLMTGRWELDPEGKSPGIYMDDPEGGDPICLCAIKRVYHPDLLSAALSHGEGRK